MKNNAQLIKKWNGKLDEIKALKAAQVATYNEKDEAYSAISTCEMIREEIRAEKDGQGDRFAARKATRKHLLSTLAALDIINERLDLAESIIKTNINKIRLATARDVLMEQLAKYDGKQAGEKTCEAICQKVKDASGLWMTFQRSCNSKESYMVNLEGDNTITTVRKDGENSYFIDDNNTIRNVPLDSLYVWYGLKIVNDPIKQAMKIQKAKQALEKAKQAAKDAEAKYNALAITARKKR